MKVLRFQIPENGNKIYIIAEGRLVNLAAGDGNEYLVAI